ncbi:RNA-directed DNA polymerase from mobile element jockey [Trichonephila clavipes]|nr:RNA-directed DNA polymerase from mobile element jockey [Trichonephila clavipes]
MRTQVLSRPFYHTEQPYVQGELKELFKERNKARKTWQHTRHPQHKTELNRLQNAIKRKIYHYRQQAWEDNLSTLNAEDNSLWGIAKAFRKKTSRFPPLMAPLILSYVLEDCGCYSDPIKPDKNSALAESYRPISLLPVLSKLAEKVILARLNDHLERENILIPEQHGFRPRLSTSHQLLRVVEFIKEGNNKDECTAAVFLDIQKAFDRVWHTGLLFKLITYKIPPPSYLPVKFLYL